MRSIRHSLQLACVTGLAALGLAAPVHAATLFSATLNGANERPTPVATAATGSGTVLLNDAETHIDITLSWENLTTNATLAHIHGPADASGTAAPIIDLSTLLPAAPNQSGTLTLSPANVGPLTAEQVTQLKSGLWYFNIHTAQFGGGEIRGQIVPEPGTALLLTAGLGCLAWVRRRGH